MGRRPATIRFAQGVMYECPGVPGRRRKMCRPGLLTVSLAGLICTCSMHAQSGVITTVVGPGLRGTGLNSPSLSLPTGVAVSGSGPGATIYTADANNCVVWQTQNGQTSIYAGILATTQGVCGYAPPAPSPTDTFLPYPVSLALCNGNLFIATHGIDPVIPQFSSQTATAGTVDEVDSGGTLSALPLPGGSDGPLYPVAVACDAQGNVYVSSNTDLADGGNAAEVNEFSPVTNGSGWTTTTLLTPSQVFDQAYSALAVDPTSGDLFGILAGQVGSDWLGTPLMGGGDKIENITTGADAVSANNLFFDASGLAINGSGDFLISAASLPDEYSSSVELVTPEGSVTQVAGNGSPGYSGDGGLGTSAQVNGVDQLVLDSAGYLYMADSENQRIRRIHPLTPGPAALNLVTLLVSQSSGAQFGSLQGVLNPTTGDFYYVVGANTVNVINAGASITCPDCERIFAAIPVGANNGGSTSTLTMVVDPTRNLVYVSNTADGNLYVIDGSPGSSTSYSVLNPDGLPLANSGASLLAIDTGLNEVYAAGPSSTSVSAVQGGRTPSLIGNSTGLDAPIQSLSVNTATHTVYAMGVLAEGYGGDYPLLYTMTPASGGGPLTVTTTQIAAVGQALPTGNFITNSIASDPQSGGLIVSGGSYYNETVDDYVAFDIFTFSPFTSEAPLPYPWQPFTTSLDVPNRAFYITDFDGNLSDSSSNAAMVIGMDSVAIGDNTLASTEIPVFGGTVSSPQTAPSPHVYDIEPDTSSYQAWISGSDATDGGFVKLWDSSTQTVTLSAAIADFGGGHLVVDSANHAAYLMDDVNGWLWLINKPQWTGTAAPGLSQLPGGAFVSIAVPDPANTIYYTTDGTPPGPGLSPTTVSCTSPCTVNLTEGVFTDISAIDVATINGTPIASNVAQGTFTAIAPTSLSLDVTPSPATTGESIDATATLTVAPEISTVTGTVNFTAAVSGVPTTVCTDVSPVLNAGSWQASCSFTEDVAGSYTISAAFSGDSMNGPSTSSSVPLQVNQGSNPVVATVPGAAEALAINTNNSGLSYSAVLNTDSSVSLVENSSLLSGEGCPAFSGLSGGTVTSGVIYLGGTDDTIYLAMISGGTLYAAYETLDSQGDCTQGSLLTLSTVPNQLLEINVDPAQGNLYVANTFGANLDELYIVPTAPWNPSALPVPSQVNLDYSATYGPIVIDPSNHQVYINDLGDSASGSAGTYSTSGFFVYDPLHSATPANNLQWVAGYISGAGTTQFNVATLLNDGAGHVILVNENPSYPTLKLSVPVTVLDTSKFSFFTNTQSAATYNSSVDITPGAGLTNISATAQYSAIGSADINTSAGVVYAYAFNANDTTEPGMLLSYNLSPSSTTPETVLSSSMAMPAIYDSQSPWSQMNYNPESTELALSAEEYGSGALGLTSPLCAGAPTLTQLIGSAGTPTTLDLPAINAISGYVYAIQPAGGYPPEPGALYDVAPPPSPCSASQPVPAAIAVVSGGGQSAVIGQAFTNPLVVRVTDASNDPVSGALVTFSVPTSGASASLSGATATTGSDGTASVTATANGIASSTAYTVSASVSGVTTPATFSLTNTQAVTTLAVTPSALSLDYGQMVTIAASISPSGVDGSVPTGSVTFYDGTTALSPNATVSSSAASYTVNVPTVGSHTYAAEYLGDSNFAQSALTSATSTVTVSKAGVTLAGPATQPVRIAAGQSGSIPVSIAGQYSGSGIAAPSGGLSYSVSGSAFGPGTLVVANGSASVPVPGTVAAGSYTVTVSYAGDSNYSAGSIQIDLVIYQPLTITPATLPAGIVGTAYAQTLSATGGSGTGYSWTVTSGTALSAVGLTLSPSGVISGDPTEPETGAAFTVEATDSLGDLASQTYDLTIYSALSISPAALPAGVVGRSYSQTLTATGGSGSGYQWGVTSGTGLSAVGLTLSSGGVISGTPTGAESAAAFTVDVADSLGDATTMTYHLTINPVLSITPATVPTGIAGKAYSQQLSATGGSGSGYTWSITVGGSSLAGLGLSFSAGGLISGTQPTAGQASFTVQLADSLGDTATQTYALTIYPMLSITPTVLPAGTAGTAYSQQLSATGGSGAGYTWSIVAGASGLTGLGLSFSAGGLISGTQPTAGQSSFTVQLADSAGNSTTQAYVLTISTAPTGSNCPTGSICVNDPETVTVNDSNSQVRLIDVSDPETIHVNDTYSVKVGPLPTSIHLSGPSGATVNQTITFTATVEHPGTALVPTGSVNFAAGGDAPVSAALNSAGVATWTTNALAAGSYTVVAAYAGTPGFSGSSASTSIRVTPSSTTVTLAALATSVMANSPVTFAATVSGSSGPVPLSGKVTFNLKGAAISGCSAVAVNAATGIAACTTSALPAGHDSITAAYTGDPNFLPSTSPAVTVTVIDFDLNLSAPPNLDLFPGQSVSFPFTVSPANGVFSGTIGFSMSGLPPDVTATFDPSTVTLGNTLQTVTVTLTAAALAALERPDLGSKASAPFLVALLLPLLGLGGVRRRLGRGSRLALILLLSLTAIAGLTACGNGGFFNHPPKTYKVTLTATSGTATHSTTFNLTVE